MERGRERAELRNQDLKRLLGELEHQRDNLMDQAAKKQGEVDAVERIIKRTYEIILDVNKDEQAHKENEERDREKQEIVEERKKARAKNDKENAPKKKKVEKKMDGLKNQPRTGEIQERARAARGKKAATKKKAAAKKGK